jgi:uncharacterized cofD-like protein
VPVTNESVHLKAEYDDGSTIVGEREIDQPPPERNGRKITTLSITPQAIINPKAKEVLENAEVIVFGPGDLYTSILANCVVGGVREVMQTTRGKKVYVSNLMTKAGQTTGMGTAEHVRELARYTGTEPDIVIVNNTPFREDLLSRYAENDEFPVFDNSADLSVKVITGDFVASEEVITSSGDVLKRSLIRHDADKLAHVIMEEIFWR